MKRCCVLLVFLCCFVTLSMAEIYSGVCGENGDNLTWTLDSETGELVISGEGCMYDFANKEGRGYTWMDSDLEYLIKSIKIGDKVTSIGGYAFHCIPYLEQVEIGNSVKIIGDYAFVGNDYLTSITIPNSVTDICWQAFYGCKNLSKVKLGNSVVNIGDEAFFDCPNLKEINFPQTLKTIGLGAFANTGLVSIELPNSLTLIGASAFSECVNLRDFTIPSSVTSIGEAAFANCSALTRIEIPSSVSSIGGYLLLNCPNITSIKVDADNPIYDSRDDCNAIIYNKKIEGIPGFIDERMESILIQGCKNTIIPNSISEIANNAFVDCTKLSRIKIPNSVRGIGDGAFSGCSGLKEIVIPNSVEYIGDGAFSGCSSLTNIEIPESVGWLGHSSSYVFSGCSEMTHIIMRPIEPPYLSQNWSNIFEDCKKLFIIYVPSGAKEKYNQQPWNNYTIVELPVEEQVDESQGVLNEELQCLVDSLRGLLYAVPTFDATFSSHGLLNSNSQIVTNKQEPTEGPIMNLLDGNFNTFFHSTWSEQNVDGEYHYIQVDFEKELSSFVMKYAKRNHGYNDSPIKIRLFATNDINQSWKEIGVIKCFYNEDYFSRFNSGGTKVIELGDDYRYVRFVVEATYLGTTNNENLFFSWSELGFWENVLKKDLTCSEDELEDFQADLFVAWQELNDLSATQETIEKIKNDINILKNENITQLENSLYDGTNKCVVPVDVYTVNGCLIRKQTNNINDLPNGIYVVRSRNSSKVILK